MKRTDIINSTVVPIGEYAFSQVVKNTLYFFPKPKRMNIHVKYIFFYQVKPVQAITHYGVINALLGILSYRAPEKGSGSHVTNDTISIVNIDNRGKTKVEIIKS